MESFQTQLENLIRQHFPDADTDLDTSEYGRVSGHVVSSRFLDETFASRYQTWKQFVAEHLTPDDREHLGTMFFFTPDQWNIDLEEQPAA